MTGREATRRTWLSILRNRVTWSFVAVVAVAVAVVTVWGVQFNSISDLAKSNKIAIGKVAKLQKAQTALRNDRAKLRDEQAARSSASDLRLCNEIEALKSVIRGVVAPTRAQLLKTTYYQQHPEQIEVAIQAGRLTAEKFAAKDCSKLPSVATTPAAPGKK